MTVDLKKDDKIKFLSHTTKKIEVGTYEGPSGFAEESLVWRWSPKDECMVRDYTHTDSIELVRFENPSAVRATLQLPPNLLSIFGAAEALREHLKPYLDSVSAKYAELLNNYAAAYHEQTGLMPTEVELVVRQRTTEEGGGIGLRFMPKAVSLDKEEGRMEVVAFLSQAIENIVQGRGHACPVRGHLLDLKGRLNKRFPVTAMKQKAR